MGSNISLEGTITSAAIVDAFVAVCAVWRVYCVYNAGGVRTRAKQCSDVFFALSVLGILANGIPMYMMYKQELHVRHSTPPGPKYDLTVLATVFDEHYFKLMVVVGLVYVILLWTLKGAFLANFADLTRHLSPRLRLLLYGTMGFVCVTFIVNVLFQLLYCRPLSTLWVIDPKTGSTSCSVLLSTAGVVIVSWTNIISDLSILFIGLAIIKSLKSTRSERSALLVVALIGLLSIVATFVRFIFSYNAAKEKSAGLNVVHQIFTWSTIETIMAYAAFSLPSLRAILNRRRDRKEAAGNSYGSRSRSFGGQMRSKGDITVLRSFDVESTKMGSEVELRNEAERNGVNVSAFSSRAS